MVIDRAAVGLWIGRRTETVERHLPFERSLRWAEDCYVPAASRCKHLRNHPDAAEWILFEDGDGDEVDSYYVCPRCAEKYEALGFRRVPLEQVVA
jgi:hypothetical protein